MQKSAKFLIGIGILAGIVGAGILVGWWGSREKPVPQTRRPLETQTIMPAPQNPSLAKMNEPASPVETVAGRTSTPPVTNTSPAVATTNLVAEWEDKLDDILGSEQDDTNKVKQLFEMFPRLPEEGQAEVAQHLSNLVPDDNYTPLGQLLQNAKLPESVLDVLISDLLNRPNSVKLPELLLVAQNPDHPKADEAKDLIELYLDEDDPAKWPQKMQEWLKENPD